MHSSPLVQRPALYSLQIFLPSAVYVVCGGVICLTQLLGAQDELILGVGHEKWRCSTEIECCGAA